jgi:hypothetical protein
MRGVDFGRSRDEKHPLSTLRDECEAVHHTIRPFVSAALESLDDGSHRLALSKMEHERYVLEHHPRNWPLVEETKDVSDEARPRALNACGQSCLTKILAWKARGEQLNLFRQTRQESNVGDGRNAWKSIRENRSGGRPYLAKEAGLMTCRC